MTAIIEKITMDNFRRYIIAPSSIPIGLGVLGYAVEYSMVLYSDSNVGLAVQVLGLGIIMGPLMMTLAIDEWVEGAGISHGGGERYEEGHSNSKFRLVVLLLPVILFFCGLIMLIGGQFL